MYPASSRTSGVRHLATLPAPTGKQDLRDVAGATDAEDVVANVAGCIGDSAPWWQDSQSSVFMSSDCCSVHADVIVQNIIERVQQFLELCDVIQT